MKVPGYLTKMEDALAAANIQRGRVYRAEIKHEDGCRGFTSGVIANCDCDADVTIVRVDVENVAPVSKWIN